MFNIKLADALINVNLTDMGFVLMQDESKDPRGNYYVIESNYFCLLIDAWFEVQLCRRSPDTDPIKLLINDKADLQSVIDWMKD